MRFIVGSTNSPAQNIEKYIAKYMQPIIEKAKSYLKKFEHFTNKISQTIIRQDDIIASPDVVFLCPSILIEELLTKISTRENLPIPIADLINHCLKSTFFNFNEQIYKETDGPQLYRHYHDRNSQHLMVYLETKAPKLWHLLNFNYGCTMLMTYSLFGPMIKLNSKTFQHLWIQDTTT